MLYTATYGLFKYFGLTQEGAHYVHVGTTSGIHFGWVVIEQGLATGGAFFFKDDFCYSSGMNPPCFFHVGNILS